MRATAPVFRFLVPLIVPLALLSALPPFSPAAAGDDAEKRLEQIEKQMEQDVKDGKPPSQEMMNEVQRIMEEMQKADEEDKPKEEAPAGFTEVPFSGFISITTTMHGEARMPQDDGGVATWTMSGHGSLSATITHSAEIRDDEGLIIGYQPVGRVTGNVAQKESFVGGGFSSVSSYSASDGEDHPHGSGKIDGWCKLYVNPAEKRYEISLPSIYLGKGRGETVITITTKDFTETRTEPWHGIRPGVSWEGHLDKDKLTYSPGSGFIAGSDTFSTEQTAQFIASQRSRDNPDLNKIVDAALEVEAMRQDSKGKAPGVGEITYTATWNLQIGKPKAKVVLEPADGYDKWKPEVPMGAGTMIRVKAKVEEPAGMAGRFEFKLEDVSKEPGVCLNHPAEDAKDDPDLVIVPSGSGIIVENEGRTARTDGETNEATVLIQARDWGAYGKLSATAKLIIGGEEVEVQAVYKPLGTPYVAIPKDDNDNSIADSWEEENGVYPCAGDADDDDTPEGKAPGDGLSAYEEYRGLFIQGFHKRFNPKKKDVFVFDPDGLVGRSDFAGITRLEVHYPADTECRCTGSGGDKARAVNFNADRYHKIDQHCLWVKRESLAGSERFNWGYCQGGVEIGPPRTADMYVLVYVDQIQEDINRVVAENRPELTNALGQRGLRPDAAWIESQVQAAIAMVTVHESCHGLGITHHYKSLRHSLPKGADIEEAILNSQISPSLGQMSCVMRYVWDGSRHPRIVINADNELLDMLRGRPWPGTLCGVVGFDDCRGQMVVSDAEQGETFGE